jgi:hypothetical protein
MHAGKVYHLAEPGALSEPVRPLRPDGSVDADVMARLSVRHDDSMQNVANRLALWDRQVSRHVTGVPICAACTTDRQGGVAVACGQCPISGADASSSPSIQLQQPCCGH